MSRDVEALDVCSGQPGSSSQAWGDRDGVDQDDDASDEDDDEDLVDEQGDP